MSPRTGCIFSPAKWVARSLMAATLLLTVPARAETSAATLLQALKAASGGAKWDAVGGVTAEGEKTSSGLTGRYHSVDDLRSGQFDRGADYGILANAEGLDRAGRWRQDNSGQIHPLDSDEAKTVAVTEAYLARRGYLFDHGDQSALSILPPAVDEKQMFDRVVATPKGGRTVVLWIRRSDHRLDRAVVQLSTVVETIRFRDYRTVEGLAVPFEIQTADGDQSDAGIAKIAAYHFEAAAREEALQRPSSKLVDATIRGGALVTYAPLALDPASGFPIVQASINGKGPFPFILDTGGHDILTPVAAAKLGLPTVGQGFSLGAGAGSTPTKFTRIDRLSLGDAELTASPFVVLQIDLGQAPGLNGKPETIAGIIGLELFERFAVTLDYGAHKVALNPLDGFAVQGKADVAVPIRFTDDLPLIKASLDGRVGSFAVDTGNNTDLIVSDGWAKANGLGEKLSAGGSMTGNSVGGSLEMKKGRAEEFEIGDARLQDLKVLLAGENMGSLSSRSEAGNIGDTVLSRFKVTFDYRREFMFLEQHSESGMEDTKR